MPVNFQIPRESNIRQRRQSPASYMILRSWQLIVSIALKFHSL